MRRECITDHNFRFHFLQPRWTKLQRTYSKSLVPNSRQLTSGLKHFSNRFQSFGVGLEIHCYQEPYLIEGIESSWFWEKSSPLKFLEVECCIFKRLKDCVIKRLAFRMEKRDIRDCHMPVDLRKWNKTRDLLTGTKVEDENPQLFKGIWKFYET